MKKFLAPALLIIAVIALFGSLASAMATAEAKGARDFQTTAYQISVTEFQNRIVRTSDATLETMSVMTGKDYSRTGLQAIVSQVTITDSEHASLEALRTASGRLYQLSFDFDVDRGFSCSFQGCDKTPK